MKIISWNINGLISFIESQSYLEIEKIDADVICFQETQTRRKLTAMSGYFHYYNPCEKEIDAEGRVLTVEFQKFFVVNCYVPRAGSLERKEFRRKFDDALKIFAKKLLDSDKKVIMCGDFNVLRTEIYGSDHAPIFLEMENFYSDDDLAEIWNKTDWIKAEKTLEKYQQALTQSVREKNPKKIENIQNMIVNSKLIKRLAVRSVSSKTNTVGVDKVRWTTSVEKFLAVGKLNKKPYKAGLLRQIILIDKGTGKERYIGMPTMYDRAAIYRKKRHKNFTRQFNTIG